MLHIWTVIRIERQTGLDVDDTAFHVRWDHLPHDPEIAFSQSAHHGK